MPHLLAIRLPLILNLERAGLEQTYQSLKTDHHHILGVPINLGDLGIAHLPDDELLFGGDVDQFEEG
jgi:hypothetical protein